MPSHRTKLSVSRDEFDAKVDRLAAALETLKWIAALIVALDIAILFLLP